MAKFFKYKSVDDIVAENDRLQIDLKFRSDFAPLFRPVQVGSFKVGNAFCVQPMEGCDGTLDGQPDELTYRRYERFGAGGAKLIWGEAAAVVDEGRANSRQLWIAPHSLASIAEMAQRCRGVHRREFGNDGDLLLGLQLTHSGRYSFRKPRIAVHDAALDPRTIVDKSAGKCVDHSYPLMTDDELKRLVDFYIAGAKLAREAGFQFVDLKQCHRYLLGELLGARSRPGSFGGSLENRTRLIRDIVAGIRAAVPDLMIATRLNAFDGLPYRMDPATKLGVPCDHPKPLVDGWGMNLSDPTQPDLTEPIWLIGELKRLGVAMINISAGNPYASPHFVRPFEYSPPDGYESPEHPLIGVDRHFRLTAQIQQAFPDLPVVGSGYSYLQEFMLHAAAANVGDGRCAFAGIGRATLSQPDFARQLQENGQLDRKRVCRTFSYCTALMRSKHNEQGQFATGCPPFDKQVYGPIWQEAQTLEVRKH